MRLDDHRLSAFRYGRNASAQIMIQGSGFMRMGKNFLHILAATALWAPIAAHAADSIFGVWVRDGHPTDKLEFYDCSGKLCAKGIQPMLDGSPAPQILRSAAKTGPNSWKGDLFNPEDGKTYTGKITYDSPTKLTLTGCLVAFLCQSETWTRVSGPPKPAAAEAKPAGKGAPAHEGEKEKEKAPEKDNSKSVEQPAKTTPAKPKSGAAPAAGKPAAPKHPAPEDADE